MAEKPEDLITTDEKIAQAKELYARGCRNYYVKSYNDAAEDLSQACTLYSEVYGPTADELGEVYLLYGKSLISLGQEENKLIDVPEEEEDDEDAEVEGDDGEEDDDEEEKEETSENGDAEKTEENGEAKEKKEENGEAGKSDEKKEENGEASGSSEAKEQNGHKEVDPDQPGPSGLNGKAAEDTDQEDAEDGNLQVAWEVLEIAAEIFSRHGESSEKNLLEAYSELAGISVENGNFDLAIKDFNKALSVYDNIESPDKRLGAEIHYKNGLCQSMVKMYDESVKSFQKAHDLLNEELEKEKAKEEQTEDVKETIKDLEELKQEIQNKIQEIGDVKADEMERVKQELSKLLNTTPEKKDDGAGSSKDADKPKPTDISHLIKRKKPDTAGTADIEGSPAKKVALDK